MNPAGYGSRLRNSNLVVRKPPDDLLIIDNHRVLHGREAFDPAVGERHIRCCGVERDDFYNNYRREAKRLGATDWGRRLSAGVI